MVEDDEAAPKERRGARPRKAYAGYCDEVDTWFQDNEISRADFAKLLRVENKILIAALRGQSVRPWILDRVRFFSGIDPPEDDRPISGQTQMTTRCRSLLTLLREIEDVIRDTKKGQGLESRRSVLVNALKELIARAQDFINWLEFLPKINERAKE